MADSRGGSIMIHGGVGVLSGVLSLIAVVAASLFSMEGWEHHLMVGWQHYFDS